MGQHECHKDRAVVLGDTGLGVSREVDKVPYHGEVVIVLGELRAQRQRRGILDRAEALEVGHDLLAGDTSMGVDVPDEIVVELVLADANLVDVLLDAREVNQRDPDLDGVGGHTHPVSVR
jgi:hypothetical protein